MTPEPVAFEVRIAPADRWRVDLTDAGVVCLEEICGKPFAEITQREYERALASSELLQADRDEARRLSCPYWRRSRRWW